MVDIKLGNLRLGSIQKERAVLAAGAIVFVILGWLLAVQPALTKLELLKRGVGTAQERSVLITEIQNLQTTVKGLEALFPSEAERHEVLGKISALANESGFSLESLVPNSEPGEPYAKLNLDLKAGTIFPLLLKFLEKVENMKPRVVVSELRVMSKLGGRGGMFGSGAPQVELVLETYLKK